MFFCETKVKFSVFFAKYLSPDYFPLLWPSMYILWERVVEEAPAISTSCHPLQKEQQGGWDVTFHAAKNKPISLSLSHKGQFNQVLKRPSRMSRLESGQCL
jgi:hypothetical protein